MEKYLKLEEVIDELKENPSKVFVSEKGNSQSLIKVYLKKGKFHESAVLMVESYYGKVSINLDRKWVEEKKLELVDFNKALDAFFFERKTIQCIVGETTYTYDKSTNLRTFAFSPEQIMEGKWYIVEE